MLRNTPRRRIVDALDGSRVPDPHVRSVVEFGISYEQAFVDWLISPGGQKTIAAYKIGGEQLFFPDAGDAKGF